MTRIARESGNRTAATAQGRVGALLSKELDDRIRFAAVVTNSTLSELVTWCLDRSLDDYVRTHRIREIKVRPGKRIRLPR